MDKEKVIQIIAAVCEDDVVLEERDLDLFQEGLLDSFGTINLLVAFEDELGINVPITVFNREEWNTPNNIVMQLEELA